MLVCDNCERKSVIKQVTIFLAERKIFEQDMCYECTQRMENDIRYWINSPIARDLREGNL